MKYFRCESLAFDFGVVCSPNGASLSADAMHCRS